MWKLLFLGRRAWKMIPQEQRRRMRREAIKHARTHGPRVARTARKAIKQAREVRSTRR